MTFDQGEFDFNASGPEEGYRHWRRDLEERQRSFEYRWGVVVGRPVRVTLSCFERPIEGIIHVEGPEKPGPGGEPVFRIKGIEFSFREVESLVRLDK